jgi:ATP-dependent DNA ligase
VADTCRMAKMIKTLPAGFVIPAKPVLASKPPSGADWVHEIKHDGYRMIVRRDGSTVPLYSRNAYDWTVRLAAIAAAAEQIKAKSFTIDGEAVVLGPDGLSRFEELSRREAARTAILYAFDLIEYDGEDLRKRPFLDRKVALGRLLSGAEAGILLNEHIAEGNRVRPCLPARRRGHRVEESRWRLPVWPVPRQRKATVAPKPLFPTPVCSLVMSSCRPWPAQ